ncbi:hypothetical protein LINPERPRIM_LOCUS12156 [Linum perenne]
MCIPDLLRIPLQERTRWVEAREREDLRLQLEGCYLQLQHLHPWRSLVRVQLLRQCWLRY